MRLQSVRTPDPPDRAVTEVHTLSHQPPAPLRRILRLLLGGQLDHLVHRPRRYRHQSLGDGIWSLRKNLTAYAAAYLTFARLLGATLVTRDEKLAAAPGLDVQVVVP